MEIHLHIQQRVFEEIYRKSVQTLRLGQVEVDPYLQRGTRNPRQFVTLVARPDGWVRDRIAAVQEQFRGQTSTHYLYPPGDFHVTVFGRPIDVDQDGRISDNLREDVEGIVGSVFQDHAPISIVLEGLNLSTVTVFVQVLDPDGALEALRRDLRARLHANHIMPGGRFPWALSVAHMNILRFAHPHVNAIIEVVSRMRALPIGSFIIRQVHLVRTDKYCSQAHTTLFKTFPLERTVGSKE